MVKMVRRTSAMMIAFLFVFLLSGLKQTHAMGAYNPDRAIAVDVKGTSVAFLKEAKKGAETSFSLTMRQNVEIKEYNKETKFVKVRLVNKENMEGVEGYIHYEDLKKLVDNESLTNAIANLDVKNTSERSARASGTIPKPLIIDISQHQEFTPAQYDSVAKQIDMVIVRVQFGYQSEYIDDAFKEHLAEFKKRGVPIHVYAWFQPYNMAEAKKDAEVFYSRAKEFNPTMYWLDVEQDSLKDGTSVRDAVSAATDILRTKVGNAKVGAYIAHHEYTNYNLKINEFDAIWIPRYTTGSDGESVPYYSGKNPDYYSDLHQYTDTGRLSGYPYKLDFNRIPEESNKDLTWFKSRITRYTTNPGKVVTKFTTTVYTDKNNTIKSGQQYKPGSTIEIKALAKTSNGVNVFQVEGGYINAMTSYYTKEHVKNPGTVYLTQEVPVYSSVEFNNSTLTGKKYAQYARVNVSDISYSANGTARFKVSGGYITADVAIASAYITNTGVFTNTAAMNIYSDKDFTKKTGKTYVVNSIFTSNGPTFNKNGAVVLKVAGGYVAGDAKFSSRNLIVKPKTVSVRGKLWVFSDPELTKHTGQYRAVGTTIPVSAIVYNSKGIPVIKTNGGYVVAWASHVSQYYMVNPSIVQLNVDHNIYKTTTFTNANFTGKRLTKWTDVNVLGITYTESGTPRLKVSGGYISADSNHNERYFSTNPGTVRLTSDVKVYGNVNLNGTILKTLKKGTLVTVSKIEYSKYGYPILKINGGYITSDIKYMY